MPVTPGAGESLIRCRHCLAILGERNGAQIVQRHRGRTTVMAGLVSITCERCQTITQFGGRRSGQTVEAR